MAGGHTDSGYHWLDSVCQQSFLPGGGWDEVHEVLGYALARLIHKDFPSMSSGQRSALFYYLGRRFFETFMQSCKIEFRFDVDHKTLHEMKCYLEESLKTAFEDSKLDAVSVESRSLQDFRKQLQIRYQKLLEDTVLGEDNENDGLFDSQQGKTRVPTYETLLRDTFNSPTTTSNIIGEGINHILQRQPHLIQKVCSKMNGRQLPPSLRRTIWIWTLVSHNGKAKYISEELVREEFKQRLALKMAQLQIKVAVSSPMRGLIKMMIHEKFKSTPCLQSLAKTSVSLTIEKAMNIYNVCSDSCDPMSILLLFPLHMGFWTDHTDEKFADSLALYLSLLELYVIPNSEEVDGIIEDVQEKLQKHDEELDDHLKSCVTLTNRRDSQQEDSPKFQGMNHTGVSYLLQQWIKEAFVGILRKPAVMFVWDQLFLHKWKPEVIADICLALVFLLRENLLNEVADMQSLIKVLSEEPSRLFTMDIQSAYQHVVKGKELHLVWTFNRRTRKGSDTPLGPPAPEEGLDFYIDGIKFLPDNTTITKITGRITSPFLDVPDLLALPDLDSDAKSPTYTYRHTFDSIEKSNLLLLRIYTVDPATKAVVIVGSCLTALCEEVDGQARVKCGSFQLRVKQGLPGVLSHLTEKVFSELPSVPGCSVLVRIQRRSDTFTKRPPYDEDTYPHVFPLSEAEQEVMNRIVSVTSLDETERQVALSLRQTEEGAISELTDEDWRKWLCDRLNKEQMLLEDKPVEQIASSRLFYYNSKIGVKVRILGGLGFTAENLYTGAVIRTIPPYPPEQGTDVSPQQHYLATTVELESSMTGPRWTEEAVLCRPSCGGSPVLFVEILGAKITHKRRHSDQNFGLDMEKFTKLAWTAAPLVEGAFVSQGRHILPLFQYKNQSLLERITSEDYLTVFKDAVKSKKAVLSKKNLFVEVEIFDGRFEHKDVAPLQDKTDLLEQTGQHNVFQTVDEMIQQGTHLSLLVKGKNKVRLPEDERFRIQETASKLFQDGVIKKGLL